MYIPGGCTDILQPVDYHFGAELKRLMGQLYQIELDTNFDMWRKYEDNSSLGASSRRRYMATWLNQIWGLFRTQRSFIEKCFDATVLITKNGVNRLRIPRLHAPYTPNLY